VILTQRLISAITALSRSPMSRNALVIEAENALKEALDCAGSNTLDKRSNAAFDKISYQRNYMRAYRAKLKANTCQPKSSTSKAAASRASIQ
jgi:hypothetical protein